ncbi:DUF6644 family protein [Flavitalea sp.]|nr:DUF6644 family protein [Flavitalea sp.]
MIAIDDLLQFLEQSSWAVAIRQSSWLYPFLEIIHITGIVLLVGAAFLFDLRLLGSSKHIPINDLNRHLLPWSLRGLFLVIPSGILLFSTNAGALGYDPVFWLKMSLLVLAASNAFMFHKVASRSQTGDKASPPVAAKVMAVISIFLWVAIISCGRLLAY